VPEEYYIKLQADEKGLQIELAKATFSVCMILQ